MSKRITISKPLGQNDIDLGGPGSGNWGHRGRPGKVGGSMPREAGMSIKSGQDWLQRYKAKAGKAHAYEKEIEAWRKEQGKQGRPANGAEAARRIVELGEGYEKRLAELDGQIETARLTRSDCYDYMSNRRKELELRGVDPLAVIADDDYKFWNKRWGETVDELNGLLKEKRTIKEDFAQATRDLLYIDPEQQTLMFRRKLPTFGKNDLRPNAITDGLDFIQHAVSGDVVLQTNYVEFRKGGAGRSSCEVDGKWINLSTWASARTVVHEMGHWIEAHSPQIRARVHAFYEKRTAGESTKPLNQVIRSSGYKNYEVTRVDKFIDAYMGKDYRIGSRRYATEILSMGLEYFHSDPVTLARQDPEYFAFIYDTVRGQQ